MRDASDGHFASPLLIACVRLCCRAREHLGGQRDLLGLTAKGFGIGRQPWEGDPKPPVPAGRNPVGLQGLDCLRGGDGRIRVLLVKKELP